MPNDTVEMRVTGRRGLEGLQFGHSPDVFASPPPLRMRLEAGRNAPRSARSAVRRLLGERTSDDFAQDAQLLTSEIVTNAMTVGGSCELSAWYRSDGEALRVEVFDTSSHVPELAQRWAPFEIGGRGLQIVDAIATKWGIEPRPGGKSVWFEMTRVGRRRRS